MADQRYPKFAPLVIPPGYQTAGVVKALQDRLIAIEIELAWLREQLDIYTKPQLPCGMESQTDDWGSTNH